MPNSCYPLPLPPLPQGSVEQELDNKRSVVPHTPDPPDQSFFGPWEPGKPARVCRHGSKSFDENREFTDAGSKERLVCRCDDENRCRFVSTSR